MWRFRASSAGRSALIATLLAVAAPTAAQAPALAARSEPREWRVAAPDAALAWFDLLAALRVAGPGAFSYTRSGVTAGDPALAARLGATRESEVLHFVPLYHPSADRAALVAALRTAAAERPAPAPRATLLVGALTRAMSPATRRAVLPGLADALERRPATAVPAADLAAWQRTLDSLYLPALRSWLVLERLDSGRLLVAPGLGPEGRLFAATADRADNLVAVGSFDGDPASDAPLLAFVRELCFPAVTRAAQAARLAGPDAESARRTSLAAVRCGARLVEARLPTRAAAYRAFWLRRSGGADARTTDAAPDLTARFDRAFPSDAALDRGVAQALARLRP